MEKLLWFMIKKRRYKSCHQFHFLSIMLIYHPSSSSWTMMIGTKMNEWSRKRWPQISITRGTLFLLWDNLFFFAKPRCLLSAFVRPHCVLHVVLCLRQVPTHQRSYISAMSHGMISQVGSSAFVRCSLTFIWVLYPDPYRRR